MGDKTDERDAVAAVLRKQPLTVRDMDLDAFADGVAAHRAGMKFHENPRPDGSIAGLSWRLGWNERALRGGMKR